MLSGFEQDTRWVPLNDALPHCIAYYRIATDTFLLIVRNKILFFKPLIVEKVRLIV